MEQSISPVVPTTTTDQPKSGLMRLCRGCTTALVARGVEGSGYCRECFEMLPPDSGLPK